MENDLIISSKSYSYFFFFFGTTEEACRGDAVTFLTKKYQAVLEHQASTISNPQLVAASRKLIPQVMSEIRGSNRVMDMTIYNMFRGACSKPGLRCPTEFCGSAKSIACFAPWDLDNGVFEHVYEAVLKVVKEVYKKEAEQNLEVQAAMIEGVQNFCPVNCDDWVMP